MRSGLLAMKANRRGERRRRRILAAAAKLSAEEGLARLSFRKVAKEARISHGTIPYFFGSKEALELAVIDEVASAYLEPLKLAEANSEPGLQRLHALALAWLRHVETLEYRAGCFLETTGHAFASQPGAVRDAIASRTRHFLGRLEEQARLAAEKGELAANSKPEVLAFQIHAITGAANVRRTLLDEPDAFSQARGALCDLLVRASVTQAQEVSLSALIARALPGSSESPQEPADGASSSCHLSSGQKGKTTP